MQTSQEVQAPVATEAIASTSDYEDMSVCGDEKCANENNMSVPETTPNETSVCDQAADPSFGLLTVGQSWEELPEESEPLRAPLALRWPDDDTYATWARQIEQVCRDPAMREAFEQFAELSLEVPPSDCPFRRDEGRGNPGPARFLVRKALSTMRRCTREARAPRLPSRPGSGQQTRTAGKHSRAGPTRAAPAATTRRLPDHHFAFRRNTAVVAPPPRGPRPPPRSSSRAMASWLETEAARVQVERGGAAYNDPAYAIHKGRFAGSDKAYREAASKASVYAADHEPYSSLAPPFVTHSVLVCGEVVSSVDDLAVHAQCMKSDRPLYNACKAHLQGRLSEPDWRRLTCALVRNKLSFSHSGLRGGRRRCVAQPPVPYVPGGVMVPAAGDEPAHEVFPDDPRYPVLFKQQGAVLSALQELDWACGCEGRCASGHEDQVAPPPPPPLSGVADSTFRHQGGAVSVASAGGANLTVAHTFPQVDAIMAVMSASGAGPSVARKLTHVAALLVGLGTSTSAANAAAIVVGFVSGDDWLYERTSSFISTLAERAKFRYQGPDEDGWHWPVTWLSGLAQAFWASAVMAAVREVSGTVSDVLALGIAEFASQIRVLAVKDAAREVLDVVVAGLKEFWGRLQSAWEQKSWAPLFGVRWDPKRWARWAEGVLINHQLLVTPGPRPGEKSAEIVELASAGAVPPWVVSPLTNGQYLALVEHLHTIGSEALGRLPNGTLAAAMRAIVTRLSAKINIVTASIRGSRVRPVPFFAYLHGPAGTGKSNLAAHIFRAVAARKGLPGDDQSRWLWQRGVNFQDGLDISKWCVALDDVDHIKGTFSASDELFPQTVVRLVNNEPFPVEAAGVEEKGTLFAAPLLVTMASNFDAEQVSKYAAFPDAFWRRVGIHARVLVKEQYRKEVDGVLTDELDPAKVGASLDIYEVYVGAYRGRQKDATSSYFEEAEKPVSVSDFLVELYARMDAHEMRQDRLLRAAEAGERCPRCYLEAGKCACPRLQRQMKRHEYSPVLAEEESADDESLPPEGECPSRVYDCFWNWCSSADDGVRSAVECGLETGVGAAAFCAVAAAKALVRCPCSFPGCSLGKVGRMGAWALSVAVQIVEDAVLEFPYATAASVLVAAAGVYALYAGGSWVLQGRGAGVDSSSWVPVPSVFGPQLPSTPPKATWTLEQLEAAVAKSLFRMRSARTSAFALAVTPNLLAIPTHLVTPGEEIELEMAPGRWQKFTAHPSWIERSLANKEMAYFAIRTAATAGVLPYLPPVHNLGVLQFDEGKLLGPGARAGGSRFRLARGLSGDLTLKADIETEDGDCGRPYAVRAGNSWWIGGVHYGLMVFNNGPSEAHAAPLTQREANGAAAHLDGGGTAGGPVVVPQGLQRTAVGEPWVLDPAPKAYSEVLTAIATGRGRKAHYLGTLRNGPPGATARSRLRPSLFAHHFRDLEEKFCGSTPYWGPPIFAGGMAEPPDGGAPIWKSPFQSAFAAGRDAKPDRATFVVALMDYLEGAEDLYWEDLHHLSLAEALVGVPELWHNPVNPSTSSGLPKNQPKWMQIQRAFKDVKLEPGLDALLGEIWTAFEGGSPVSVPGAWTLKDEPARPGKEARVFTVLPVSFNVCLARVLAPVYAAMRAHPEFFECWVGVDMTSPDVERLVRFLKHVCPQLDRVGDVDAVKQDKAFDTFSWMAVRMVYSAIGHHAGLDRRLIDVATRSEEFVQFLYKGDLFEHPQDPSGVKGVIENNSIDCSVKPRYDYYRERPDFVASVDWRGWLARFQQDPTVPKGLGFTFRRDCANAQFGDDNIHALRPGVPPVVHPERLLRECGVEVTSGDKSGTVALGSLQSVSFLKRTLVFDAELGYHLAPLALKSIVKTCVVRMPTTLSDSDHAALVLTHVVREAALHGPEIFEDFRSRALRAAAELKIEGHKLLRIHTYSNYRERLRKGIFSVYRDLGETGCGDYLAAESAGLIGAQTLLPQE